MSQSTESDSNQNQTMQREPVAYMVMNENYQSSSESSVAKNSELREVRHESGISTQVNEVVEPQSGTINDGNEHCISEETITNLYHDFNTMPHCAEKSLINLLYLVSLKLVDIRNLSNDDIVIPAQIETEISKQLNCLKERLIIEDLQSKAIQNLIETCHISIKDVNWQATLTKLKHLYRELSPLNIHELFRLIEKVDEATHLMQGKDIILFLGDTGSGKSTTIHFLAGSTMVRVQVNGLNHITTTDIKHPKLKKVTTSPFARSETRYITTVEVNYENVGAYTKGSIILCDTPGFGDTNGPEVDIANGIGVVKAVKGSKSVKPVILFSYKSIGDRGSGIKNLAHVIVGLIPNIIDHRRAFSYMFTKFPDEERRSIHPLLVDIHKNLNTEEISDVSFTGFLIDMLRETRRSVVVLDPTSDSPGDILDDLARSASIDHPDEVFHYFTAEKSKATVRDQVKKHQVSIMSATKRYEYSLIEYKLDQLNSLCKLLEQDDIEQVYNACIRHISTFLNEQYEHSISTLNRCLSSQTISNKDIEQYHICIDHAKRADKLREKYLVEQDVFHSSAYIEHLNERIDVIIRGLQAENLDKVPSKISLNKIKILAEYFPDINSKYKNACKIFADEYDRIVQSFKNKLTDMNMIRIANDLTKLSDACTILEDHLNKELLEKKYNELKSTFLQGLRDLVPNLDEKISGTYDEKTIKNLIECINTIETALKTTDLQKHIQNQDINLLYKEIILKVVEQYNQINEKIMKELKTECSYIRVEKLFEKIVLIRKISAIAIETNQDYYRTLEYICGCIREMKRNIESALINFNSNENNNYVILMKTISNLKDAKWIEVYRTDAYSDVFDDVKQQILRRVKNLQKAIQQKEIDLDICSNITFMNSKVLAINEMKIVVELVPDIEEVIRMANEYFKSKINNVLNSLRTAFNINSWRQKTSQYVNFNLAEKGFKFLTECRSIDITFEIDSTSVTTILEDFIREFSSVIHEEMKNSFNFIKAFPNNEKKQDISDQTTNNFQNVDQKQKLFNKATILYERLQEISDIIRNCPSVFEKFPQRTIMNDFVRDLETYLEDLSSELVFLNSEEDNEAFQNKLLIVKALSTVDPFLKGNKYNNIYSLYQKVFIDTNNERVKRVIDNINNFKYEEIQVDLDTLRASKEAGHGQRYFEQAKRVFNIGLSRLLEETKTQAILLGSKLELQAIKSVVDSLKRMENAKRYMSEYTDKSDQIDICINEVKTIIEGRMNAFLISVNALNEMSNFYEAGERVNHIQIVKDLLGIYCAERICHEIEALNQNQDKVLDDVIVKKYTEMDISEYILNPPKDIFERLKKASETDGRYVAALRKIWEGISNKLRKELGDAIEIKPPNSNNSHVRRYEAAIKYLPQDLSALLEIELRLCKEQINENIKSNDKQLKEVCETNDIKCIKQLILEYRTINGMQNYADKGQEHIRKQIRGIVAEIIHDLKERRIENALSNVKKVNDYRNELKDVADIEQLCREIRLELMNVFQEVYISCMTYFSNEEKQSFAGEVIEIPENDIFYLIRFIKFRDEYQTQNIFESMFPNDFDKNLINFTQKFVVFFNNSQEDYRKALENIDLTSIQNIFSIVKKWNSLLIKIKKEHYEGDKDTSLMFRIIECVAKLITYPTMLESISSVITNIKNELIENKIINDDINEIEKDRERRFRNLNTKISVLIDAKRLRNLIFDIDPDTLVKECLAVLENRIKEIFSLVQKVLERFFKDNHWTNADGLTFNNSYANLISYRQEMKLAQCGVTEKINKIQEIVYQKIEIWATSIITNSTLQNTSSMLINIKRVAMNMPAFKTKIDTRIDELLSNYKRVNTDNLAISKLGTVLNHDKAGIGQCIIGEQKIFEGYSLSLFNEKTQRHDIKYVLDNIEGDMIDSKLLRKRFDEFNQIYQDLIRKYLQPNMKLEPLISDIKLIAGVNKQNPNTILWDATIRGKIPKLTAHIFALWTLKSAEHYFEATGSCNQSSYLLQPHAAQVISIFRMIGIGDKKEELSNNLVQIGTGEGKSITLGATACILALLGFDIYCTCYSQYLSQRDYKAFLPLFDSLGLVNHIHYGTFNKLCEDLINEDGEIRQTVEQIISQNANNLVKKHQTDKRAKILLIDEVDVFFSEDFFGNLYTPVASLRDPTITALVYLIWNERGTPKNINELKMTTEYNECVNRYPVWKFLIDEAIKDMLFDIHKFESHSYTVKNDQIGYIEQDSVIYNVSYGYKTLFAYLHEHEKGKVSKASLEKNICIKIKCGSFSYAEIPLDFTRIMGVTGTLRTLSDPEKSVIQDVYKIQKNTFMPSVFGANNLIFRRADDIKIENQNDYFNVIKREIDNRLCGTSPSQRAVLVFFESEQKLKEFYDSRALNSLRGSVVYLTEKASLEEKETIIKSATVSGKITLFTRVFGRGTDFICYDQTVLSNGGTHVIQTFLSEEMSEEVQIKGRTARQGNTGSYNMVLLDLDLEKFQIEKSDIEDIRAGKGYLSRLASTTPVRKDYATMYDLLHEKRTETFKSRYENNRKYVQHAHYKHIEAKNFLLHLSNNKLDNIKKFLADDNRGAEILATSRTVCLMDATGSMLALLHKSKNTVDIMFERASEILKENKIKSDSFQIQFAVYRNYDSREEKILQYSPWETKPDNLRAFMNTIEVEGGLGNEAIEIGLWHANQEHERERITQVILIGDAPPNTRSEVEEKRKRLSEQYWLSTKFANQTYYENQLENLKKCKIPVHAFYVADRARTIFREIARTTGGRCEMLDINSPAGAQMLTNLVTEEILKNVGGPQRGSALVQAYRRKYSREYTA